MGLEIVQIIEDDPGQARLLDQVLRQAAFRTNVAFDGPSGIQDVWRIKPSLVMTDDNLPGMSGRDLCQRLRQDPATKHIPVIMLSGYSSEERRVEAFEGGADDFILKPYSAGELVARVRAVLRRCQQATVQEEDLDEELTFEDSLYVVAYRGIKMTLTSKEWKALRRFASTVGKVVPKEELKSLLWGDDILLHDHELDRCVEQLNRKLAEDRDPLAKILAVPGGGYRLVAGSPVAPDTLSG
jgi:DNA-binding response OmpR family regulator